MENCRLKMAAHDMGEPFSLFLLGGIQKVESK
jgi:hypothetical protein